MVALEQNVVISRDMLLGRTMIYSFSTCWEYEVFYIKRVIFLISLLGHDFHERLDC